ncbi:FG-GAP repeat domain-containing protein [Candidatus Omnitrophota bacterium]
MKRLIAMIIVVSTLVFIRSGFAEEAFKGIKIEFLGEDAGESMKYATEGGGMIQLSGFPTFPNQDGWPVEIEAPFNLNAFGGKPIVADFIQGDNGEKEVIYAMGDDLHTFQVYVYSLYGVLENGWPLQLDGNYIQGGETMMLGDIDGDRIDELVIALDIYSQGQGYRPHVYVIENDLTVRDWPIPNGITSFLHPVLANLDYSLDGSKEIIVRTLEYLNVYDGDGNVVDGFPVVLDNRGAAPVAGDVDNDGEMEIVVVDDFGPVRIIGHSGIVEAVVPLGEFVRRTPVLGDIDNDGYLEIVIPQNNDGIIYVFSHELEQEAGWPFVADSVGIPSALSLGNVTADPGLEVIFHAHCGNLFLLRSDGTLIWQKHLEELDATGRNGITVGDVNNDRKKEILMSGDGMVVALTPQGDYAEGFPFSVEGLRCNGTSEVILDDIDEDSDLELIFTDNYTAWAEPGLHYINIIDVPSQFRKALNDWSIFQHDYQRSGLVSTLRRYERAFDE